MTGCRMNVHFIGGRMAQKRTGRAARCGPASRHAGEYGRSRSGYRRDGLMARFGQDVALLHVLPRSCGRRRQRASSHRPRAVPELITASTARHRADTARS
jgi:hypothetical protein